MGRSPCCEKVGIKKGPWTPEEDQKLLAYIEENGHGSWRALPAKAGLQRCGKSCRLRWTNYLRPDIKRGKFSLQEEQSIIQLHALLGNRWSAIATHLPKRTDNEIKNYWNTHLKKRLTKMGIDPVTHKPKSDALTSLDGHSKNTTNLSHMAQWESARLEAEARLVRESKLRCSSSSITATTFQQSTPFSYLDTLHTWQGICSKLNKANGIVDLESPTSTLSFSENNSMPLGGVGGGGTGTGSGGIEVEEEEDWKCFRKPTNIFEAKENNLTNQLPILEATIFGGNTSWLQRPMKHGNGFTEMLLENPEEGNSSTEFNNEESDYGSGGGGDGGNNRIINDEDNKDYWDSIMDLVNSVSTSGSSSLF